MINLRRFFTTQKKNSSALLDVTPFADIVFLLLIFFMLSSTFVSEPGIKLNLPKTKTAEIDPDNKIIVTVSPDETIYINDKRTTLDEVESEIKVLLMSKPSSPVILRADKNVKHGVVVSLLDKARLAGAKKLAVAAERSER